MRRRVFAAACAAMLMTTMAGCGAATEQATADVTAASSTAATAEENAGSTSESAALASTGSSAADASSLAASGSSDEGAYSNITLETKNYTGEASDGTKSIKGTYQQFVIPNELEGTNLGNALHVFNTGEESESDDYIKNFADEAASVIGASDAVVTTPYEFDTSITITRADDSYFSFLTEDYSDTHGAHPSTGHRAYTIDVKEGTQLTLTDVLPDTSKLAERLSKDLLDAYGEQTFFSPDTLTEDVQTMIDSEGESGNMVWYLNNDDTITFLFPQYAVAPYAAGEQTLTYDLTKLKSGSDDALTGASNQ